MDDYREQTTGKPSGPTAAQERERRKIEVALGYRILAANKLGRRGRRPHQRARPGAPRLLLAAALRPLLPRGARVGPRARGAERRARGGRGDDQHRRLLHPPPDPRGAARRGERRPRAHGLGHAVLRRGPHVRADHAGVVRLLRGPRAVRRRGGAGAERGRGQADRRRARPEPRDHPAQPRAAHGRRQASRRRSAASCRWSAWPRRT